MDDRFAPGTAVTVKATWSTDEGKVGVIVDEPNGDDCELSVRIDGEVCGYDPEDLEVREPDPVVLDLVKALERVTAIARLVTVRQVLADEQALEASGLNPWCVNEGLATGDERVSLWFVDAAVQRARDAGLLGLTARDDGDGPSPGMAGI